MRLRLAALSAAAAVALVLGSALPASAIGNSSVTCPSGSGSIKGYSYNGGAQTYVSGGCAAYSTWTIVKYNAYPGSPLYTTSAVYGYPNSSVSQSGTVAGIHQGTGSQPFNT